MKPKQQNWDAVAARCVRQSEIYRVARWRYPVDLLVRGVVKPSFVVAKRWFSEERLLGHWYDRVTDQMNTNMATAFIGQSLSEKDVLAIGYFKAGTNWTMQTCYQIAHRGKGEFDHIQDVVSWPDAAMPEKWVGLNCPDPYGSPTGLRVIKSHCLASQVPSKNKARIIVVTRDPKDVLVSSYHFFRSLVFGKLMCSPEMWLERFLSNKALFGGWHEYTGGWYALRDRENVLFLTFEQMKQQGTQSISLIADHMKVVLSEEELAMVRHKSSFDYMKAINHKFYPANSSVFSLAGGEMIRSGKSGDGESLFTVVQLRRVDRYFSQKLKEMGSDFPYNEYYGNW